MFSFVDLRLLLLLGATALLTHGQEDSKFQTLGSLRLLGIAFCSGFWQVRLKQKGEMLQSEVGR